MIDRAAIIAVDWYGKGVGGEMGTCLVGLPQPPKLKATIHYQTQSCDWAGIHTRYAFSSVRSTEIP